MNTSEDLLASWADTPTRRAITEFVGSVAGDGPASVPPEERVAVFDNDGCLWCEKPMPIQLDFTLRRLAAMAEDDPGLRSQQPWKACYEKDMDWLGEVMVKHYKGDDADLQLLMSAASASFAGLGVEDYAALVTAFFDETRHPVLDRPYRACGYQPMVELLRYLEANGFSTYIASAGDRDFMRPVAGALYGIPPERVIGSSLAIDYREGDGGTDVLYKSHMDFFDDGPTKPIRIWSRLGRRPVAAVGNSNGDIPMLRFARRGDRPALRLLLLHDDADREFAYTAGAEDALARAATHGWNVVSMRDDWSTVFADA